MLLLLNEPFLNNYVWFSPLITMIYASQSIVAFDAAYSHIYKALTLSSLTAAFPQFSEASGRNYPALATVKILDAVPAICPE